LFQSTWAEHGEPTHPLLDSKERIVNRDQTKGRIEQANGRAKETIGKIRGDKKQERKGKTQRELGRAQAQYGDHQEDIKKPETEGAS
jgi:uncharacterized protein YjbJ (UPF0337 family)